MLSVLAPLATLLALADPGAIEKVGRLDDPAIREASGIVASRVHPGIFWVHNDSGNPPELFAVRRDGSLVRKYRVGVPNVDWEDIAVDDQGHIFLGDIGNNFARLPLRAIYRLDEPDPSKEAKGPLKATLSSFYQFPSKAGRFDAESLFIDGGKAVVISKNLDGKAAELFMIPLDPPGTLLKPTLPVRLGKLPKFKEPATGADLSADGRLLAVCSVNLLRVYGREGDHWKLLDAFSFRLSQVEAIAWDGEDLLLADEGRDLFRVSLRKARR